MSLELERIFAFVIELDKLKGVLRKTKPVGLDRYENTAEHSWQLCMLAVALAEHAAPAVSITRVVELLLVHDVPEIDAGDKIVYAGKDETTIKRERLAAERIFGLLPEPTKTWFMVRWREFEERVSPEAQFAYAMDRLMPVLHNLYNNGQSWREHRIPLSRIVSVNSTIGEACPAVWSHIQQRLNDLAEQGFFASYAQQGAQADSPASGGPAA